MGMFDDITYEAPCPICGLPLTGWQSKDAECCLSKLTPSELWQQSEAPQMAEPYSRVTFYTSCRKCGTWVDITLSPAPVELTDEDYTRMRNREPSQVKRGPIIPNAPRSAETAETTQGDKT